MGSTNCRTHFFYTKSCDNLIALQNSFGCLNFR